TVQGHFLIPIPWEGACILVAKPSMSANGTLYPVIVGASPTVTSNGTIRIVRVTAGDYRYRLSPFGGASPEVAATDDSLQVVAFSASRETRKGYATSDGITVTESGPVAPAVNGNGVALGYASGQDYTAHKARFGNVSGVLGDTVATGNTMTIFELHFFKVINL